MVTEKLAAIVIGIIMLFSVAGFASFSLIGRIGDPQPQQQTPEIPNIVTRPLTGSEISYILQTGRVVLRDYYPSACAECLERNTELELFANQFSGFVVLEEVAGNQTRLEMIDSLGKVTELDPANITLEGLTDSFCRNSIVKPRECILRNI